MSDNPFLSPEHTSAPPKAANGWRFPWIATLCCLGGAFVLFMMLAPMVRYAPNTHARLHCQNNLKLIALALHSYHDEYDSFPPAFTVDADGKPLHSWRTLVLPYLDQKELYAKIDLSKPWDDPANAKVGREMPNVYACPSGKLRDGETIYLGVGGAKGVFAPAGSRKLFDISDGASNTLMLIEADLDHAVPWMSPVFA